MTLPPPMIIAGVSVVFYDDVTGFVLEQLRKMPGFLSRSFLLARAVFGMRLLLLEGVRVPQEARHLGLEI
jgi:hypothetical protein